MKTAELKVRFLRTINMESSYNPFLHKPFQVIGIDLK